MHIFPFRRIVLMAFLLVSIPVFSQRDCSYTYDYSTSEVKTMVDALLADKPAWTLYKSNDNKSDVTLVDASADRFVWIQVQACERYQIKISIQLNETRSQKEWAKNEKLLRQLLGPIVSADDALSAIRTGVIAADGVVYEASEDRKRTLIAYTEQSGGGCIISVLQRVQ